MNIEYVTSFIFTSDKYRCLTRSAVTRRATAFFLKQTYSRDNTHRATYYDKIQYLVCTFQKPNCELAAVCKQSCTHCVLSPAISLHVPPHREIKHFLHKDSSGNMVDFVFSSGEVALYSVRSVTWTLVCCPLSFMFLLYEM